MAYKHLFVDSDVILDMLFKRDPFYKYMEILVEDKDVYSLQLSTSSLVIANINYLFTKKAGAMRSKEGIRHVVNLIKVLPFEKDAIDNALASPFTDFEDAIQHHIAVKHKCDLIITRNIKDYKQSTIPVLTAEQFLRTL
jgi:predicted nucleic acid-binding protein